MITSIRCVPQFDLWPWPISSRLFSHDFAIKLLEYITSCHVRSAAHTVLDGFFQYLAQIFTSIRRCVVCNDPWSWPISSWSFSHYFAIKLLKCDTPCCVCSTACTVLYRFFPSFAQMITNMRVCVKHNDFWPWSISSQAMTLQWNC